MQNLELRLELPALEKEVKLMREDLQIKLEENNGLNERFKNIEKLWKNNAKEPHKLSRKNIFREL